MSRVLKAAGVQSTSHMSNSVHPAMSFIMHHVSASAWSYALIIIIIIVIVTPVRARAGGSWTSHANGSASHQGSSGGAW